MSALALAGRHMRMPTNASGNKRFKDLLATHVGERRGSILLIVILVGLSIWAVSVQWFPDTKAHNMEPLRAELEAWLAERDTASEKDAPVVALAEPFPFDPNTIGREEWHALGITDKQVDGLERYMKKGGRFRTKNDLGKMYSIKPEQFERLKPFILLPDSLPRKGRGEWKQSEPQFAERAEAHTFERATSTYERPSYRKVEVNTADTNMLIALPGIGPTFARGIVKYRESLGGYHSLDQLGEVYVLKDKPDAVTKLKELLVLDTLMLRRIPISSCTVEELAAHPYARWKIAKPLIAFRTQHGAFKQVEDIKGCALVDAEVFRKLAPYLSVE